MSHPMPSRPWWLPILLPIALSGAASGGGWVYAKINAQDKELVRLKQVQDDHDGIDRSVDSRLDSIEKDVREIRNWALGSK